MTSRASDSASIAAVLSARLNGAWTARPLNASSFCSTWRAQRAGEALFVKSLSCASARTLAAEADGLQALAATRTIRVPIVIGCWNDADSDVALLALEWLAFGHPDPGFGERFGHALAALHRAAPLAGDGRFGWRCDNMLGGTLQSNRWSEQGGRDGWLEFFGRERLGAMRERLIEDSAPHELVDSVAAVIEALPHLLAADDHEPRASLIHGDLWSGNWGALTDGTPVIFDPAVSSSDAEADLAMMELFGAPPAGFWPAYRESFPIAEGYARRRSLYQLYHLLNHALLFGGGYVQAALSMSRSLL